MYIIRYPTTQIATNRSNQPNRPNQPNQTTKPSMTPTKLTNQINLSTAFERATGSTELADRPTVTGPRLWFLSLGRAFSQSFRMEMRISFFTWRAARRRSYPKDGGFRKQFL